MEHSETPFIAPSSEFDETFRARLKEILSSPYYEYVLPPKQWVVGKTVALRIDMAGKMEYRTNTGQASPLA